MLKIEVYTDGACKGNPGRGGWGVTYSFEVKKGVEMEWVNYGGKMKTTNNEMELTAFLEALKMCPKGHDLTIYSDSTYVLNTLVKGGKEGDLKIQKRRMGNPKYEEASVLFTGWITAWMKNGWKKKDGKTISNLELWKETVEECKKHLWEGSKIKCVWVKGHNGIIGNELADELANLGVPKRN